MRHIAVGLILFAAPIVAAPAVAQAEWRVNIHTGAREPPPPPVEEHPRTRAGYVWTGGHHEWRHGRYTWVSGHLVREHRGREWNDGRWERHEDHYDYYRGGWRPRR